MVREIRKGRFLSLEDSITCLNLILNNPPHNEYRVYNQFDEYYSLNYIAGAVAKNYKSLTGTDIEVSHIDDPRIESQDHYYNPANENLKKIGYRRQRSLDDEIPVILSDLENNKRLIKLKDSIMPKTKWNK